MSIALSGLDSLNQVLKKLGFPSAQELRGRTYCFITSEANVYTEVLVEVGTIARITYDIGNEEIQIVPDAYSREAFSTIRINISVDPDPKSSDDFGKAYLVLRTTDDLATEINSHASVPIDFKIL